MRSPVKVRQSLLEEEKADSMIKEPVDTAAQRVLIFGDSMSEYRQVCDWLIMPTRTVTNSPVLPG